MSKLTKPVPGTPVEESLQRVLNDPFDPELAYDITGQDKSCRYDLRGKYIPFTHTDDPLGHAQSGACQAIAKVLLDTLNPGTCMTETQEFTLMKVISSSAWKILDNNAGIAEYKEGNDNDTFHLYSEPNDGPRFDSESPKSVAEIATLVNSFKLDCKDCLNIHCSLRDPNAPEATFYVSYNGTISQFKVILVLAKQAHGNINKFKDLYLKKFGVPPNIYSKQSLPKGLEFIGIA